MKGCHMKSTVFFPTNGWNSAGCHNFSAINLLLSTIFDIFLSDFKPTILPSQNRVEMNQYERMALISAHRVPPRFLLITGDATDPIKQKRRSFVLVISNRCRATRRSQAGREQPIPLLWTRRSSRSHVHWQKRLCARATQSSVAEWAGRPTDGQSVFRVSFDQA